MEKLKKIIITLFFSLCLLLTIIPTQVNALDATMTIGTMTQSTWTTILTYLKANQSNWFTDYNYVIYGTPTYYYNIMLVPKVQTSMIIFADNQVDSPYQSDIDKWYMQYTCSTAYPCLVKRFNSSGAIQFTASFTTNQNTEVTSTTSYIMYYTNFTGYTYRSYYTGETGNTNTSYLNLANYGLYYLPNSWLTDYIQQTTDSQQTQDLITANWGMFNFLANGINAIWAAAQPIMNNTKTAVEGFSNAISSNLSSTVTSIQDAFGFGWAQGILYLFGVPTASSNNLFQWIANITPSWITNTITYLNGVFGAIVNLVPYTLFRFTQFLSLTGTQITGGVITSLLTIPNILVSFFGYFPDPIDDVFSAVFSIFTFSTAVRVAWYIATLGGKT